MRSASLLSMILAVALVSSTACANLHSISRTTKLPSTDYRRDSKGVAIHLDAKQRLAFAKAFGAVCAEPSPDALSAFASSLSAGGSLPNNASGTIAATLSESASSIGLRTQSIQLMRDALYRACEAYYGRAINSAQLMELHMRYQDIMVAILAIEQLTGVVAAGQAALGSSGTAGASSELVKLDGLLQTLRDMEAERHERLRAATEKRNQLQGSRDETRAALDAAQAADPVSAERVERLTAELADGNAKLEVAEQEVAAADALAKQATNSREAVEKNRDVALSAATSTSSASARVSGPVIVSNVDQHTAQAIATAVNSIVASVMGKERVLESCLRLLNEDDSTEHVRTVCTNVILGSKADDAANPRKQRQPKPRPANTGSDDS